MSGQNVNVRLLALETLLEAERGDRQSHLLIRDVLDKYEWLPERDRAFFMRLCEGTLEYRLQLDYVIDRFSNVPSGKQKPVIREILRMGVYQLLYMDAVPDAAAVNESVRLAGKKGFASLRGFVNGVLRAISRNSASIRFPSESNRMEYLSVRYSMPRWIVKMWCDEWDDNAENDSVYADALRSDEGSLITWRYWPKGTQKYEPLVRKAAIIVDNMSASAAESPIYFVRNHNGSRAKVYGKERTMGCEQSGNCNTVRLPHSNIFLTYPMTVYGTFEKACKGRNPGHKPDVIIPLPYSEQLTDNIDSWVLWVAKKM